MTIARPFHGWQKLLIGIQAKIAKAILITLASPPGKLEGKMALKIPI